MFLHLIPSRPANAAPLVPDCQIIQHHGKKHDAEIRSALPKVTTGFIVEQIRARGLSSRVIADIVERLQAARITILVCLSVWFIDVLVARCAAAEAFAIRGYYTTFMRMPTFGLAEWKEMIDCMERDEVNTLLLWTAGGFRSKKFPVSWQYNREHKNVEQDFVRELIDYTHSKKIKVLLGFTPFAYDGVNQYPLEHPELKAAQKSGEPANLWGMHSWGYNLCPAKPESQRFMVEYLEEMFFEFYPNADGLTIESSDYAICYCVDCREKFFDHEFAFVRRVSNDVWQKKPNAMIVVYPHYFSGRKVPGFEVMGAKQAFDARWTLFFTPHSAHVDTNLLRLAKSSILWNEGLTLGLPAKIRDGARLARQHGITGYVPSLEPFSCIDGPPGSGKPRQKPFHFEWLRDGQMPLNELLTRLNRLAYREYSRDPDLSDATFKRTVRESFFGASNAQPREAEQAVDDLLYVQESWFLEADWFKPSPLLTPARLNQRAAKESWPPARLNAYSRRIERLREIEQRYKNSSTASEREMGRIALLIVSKWDTEK